MRIRIAVLLLLLAACKKSTTEGSVVAQITGGDTIIGAAYESVPAVMRRGSVLVWHGSLWHGGGANTTPDRRVGIAMNYCAGYIRQQENQQLGIPREVAAGFGERLQQLCGYSVYHGLIGHIDKHDPIELLQGERQHRMVWDA